MLCDLNHSRFKYRLEKKQYQSLPLVDNLWSHYLLDTVPVYVSVARVANAKLESSCRYSMAFSSPRNVTRDTLCLK